MKREVVRQFRALSVAVPIFKSYKGGLARRISMARAIKDPPRNDRQGSDQGEGRGDREAWLIETA